MCPRTVELIGYGNGHSNKMHWTVPNVAGQEHGVELASAWSDMQLWFHTVDDFAGHEDWEWLARHRDADLMVSYLFVVRTVYGSDYAAALTIHGAHTLARTAPPRPTATSHLGCGHRSLGLTCRYVSYRVNHLHPDLYPLLSG